MLTSDHGGELLEHGALEHGHGLHQELLAPPRGEADERALRELGHLP